MPRRLVRRPKPDPEPEEPEPEAAQAEPEPLLYNVDAACRMLGGISRGMLYRLVSDKQLRSVKIGGRTLIKAEDLKSYVDSL